MRCRTAAAACCLFAGLAHAGDAVPHGVGVLPLRAALHEDVRVLWMGDSYSIPSLDRPSAGSLLSWRIDRWTAFQTGDGPSWFCAGFEELAPGIATISGANAYRLHPVEADTDPRFGLPLWRLREFVPGAGSTDPVDLMRYRMRPYLVAAGFAGRFVFAGDTASVRPLLLDAPGTSASVASITIAGGPSGDYAFDPRSETRPRRLDGQDPDADAPVAPSDGQIYAPAQ